MKFIVENFLEDVVCFNIVCNMFGYIGIYKGYCVFVMGIGMGMFLILIYVCELIVDYGVKILICVGMVGVINFDIYVCEFVLV